MKTIKNTVKHSVNDSFRNSVWDSVENSVWDSVNSSIHNSVWKSVRNPVLDFAWYQVGWRFVKVGMELVKKYKELLNENN